MTPIYWLCGVGLNIKYILMQVLHVSFGISGANNYAGLIRCLLANSWCSSVCNQFDNQALVKKNKTGQRWWCNIRLTKLTFWIVDHPTQLICIWIFILCQHTKKRRHSRVICYILECCPCNASFCWRILCVWGPRLWEYMGMGGHGILCFSMGCGF